MQLYLLQRQGISRAFEPRDILITEESKYFKGYRTGQHLSFTFQRINKITLYMLESVLRLLSFSSPDVKTIIIQKTQIKKISLCRNQQAKNMQRCQMSYFRC